MPEKNPETRQLNVLPNSGMVEKLREQFAQDTPANSPQKNLADLNVIDRAMDASKSPQQRAIEEKVIDVLKTIFDPEIPVSIYELGLIYAIEVAEDNAVRVKMTLTAPACPVAGSLPPEVERKIENIPEVRSATVELVWEPPWTRERMSEVARLELGM